MKTLAGILYTKDHEWVKRTDEGAYIGITDFAQEALGDIVYVDLPKVGAGFRAGDAIAAVESVKTASDVFVPVDCTVLKVNQELESAPERLNSDPYQAWIALVELKDPAQLGLLMDEAAYREYCASI